MYKFLLFKEWLKIKWVAASGYLLFILISAYTFLTIRSAGIHSGESEIWYKFIFVNSKFYNLYQLAPIAFGLALAIFQFIPELNQKRLRLTFHLPLDQKKTLFTMVLFGQFILWIGLLLLFASFALLNTFLLPIQLLQAAILSILPWGLAGVFCYNYVVTILLEPVLTQRIFHFFAGLIVLFFYLQNTIMEGLIYQIPFLLIIATTSMAGVIYAGSRFGKN